MLPGSMKSNIAYGPPGNTVYFGNILLEIAMSSKCSNFQIAPANLSPVRPNSPQVTNLVTGESLNRQPSFWSFVRGCGRILGIHGQNLLLGFGWAEPVLLRKQRPARLIMT